MNKNKIKIIVIIGVTVVLLVASLVMKFNSNEAYDNIYLNENEGEAGEDNINNESLSNSLNLKQNINEKSVIKIHIIR